MKKSSRAFLSCFTLIFTLLLMLQGPLSVQAKATPSSSALEIMYSELISTGKISKEITHQPIKTNKILEEGLPPTSTNRQEINQPATFSPSSSGQTWYVSTTGDNSNTCLSPDLPCKTMNAAINKASNGDVINITDETFYFSGYHWESEVVLINKNIELSGGWNATFTNQDGYTTVDGVNAKRGITISSGVSTSINYFMVINGKAYGGGGISNQGSATLNNLIIHNNETMTTYGGGGVSNEDTITINNSFIYNNKAAYNGGGIYADSDSVTYINQSAIYSNEAQTGGGVTVSGYSNQLIIHNSTITNNVADKGGGLDLGSNTTLYNVTIANNHAESEGGGTYIASYGSLTIFNSIFSNNTTNLGFDNCGGWGQNYFDGYSIDYPASCSYVGWNEPRGIDPKLDAFFAPLGYYPLLADSPAINTGNLSTCSEVDQRGMSRPQGFGCDIGAFEYVIPGAFEKLVPTEAEAGVSLSPTLSWQTSSGATSYEYCYSSAPGPCTKWNSVGGDTSVTLSDLAPGYSYYWQARAVNAGGTTEADNGTWWLFTIIAAPACTWPAYTPPTTPTFGDVPMDAGHWSWVERLANSTITAGCGNGNYCPFSEVVRAQMAIFLLRGKHCGSSYTPPAVGATTGGV